MEASLETLVWDAYWQEGNTKLALERVVQVVRDYDKVAELNASQSKITKISHRRRAA